MGYRSTFSDANKRHPESILVAIYRHVYAQYRHELSSDSRKQPQWLNRLQIIDSTAITLFFQPDIQRRGTAPQAGQKERGHQGAFDYPCQ